LYGSFKRGVKNEGKNNNVKTYLGVLAKLWKAVVRGVSKKIGEWYQQTNTKEDKTN
jgi:hypothetical protein